MKTLARVPAAIFIIVIALGFASVIPKFVRASDAANIICQKVQLDCGGVCGMVKNKQTGKCENKGPQANPINCKNICIDTEKSGKVWGHCTAEKKCHGDSYTGLNGKTTGTDAGMQQLMSQLGQMLGQLMKGGQGSGSGSGSGSGTGTGTNSTGCTSYYQSPVPTSDPCAYVVPNGCVLESARTIGTMSITVGSSSAATTTDTASVTEISVTPSTGPAPLAVTFGTYSAGALDFGDGTASTSVSSAGCTASSTSCTPAHTAHTYTSAGTYTVTLTKAAAYVCPTNTSSGSDYTSSGGGSLTDTLGGSSDTTSDFANSDFSNSGGGGNDLFPDFANDNKNNNNSSSSNQGGNASGTAKLSLLPNLGGALGDIQLSGNGATVLANTVDSSGNTAVAGFYGTDSSNGQASQTIASQMCQTRPWATNFLSYVIPPTFFDGLCQWRGYKVGATTKTTTTTTKPATTLTQTRPSKPTRATSSEPQINVSGVTPKVRIWAVPAAVTLGTRTQVFWSSQGVTDCQESSPDGSFSSKTLQGGAATVPITGATTFTITCTGPDGAPISDYVTVNLAI